MNWGELKTAVLAYAHRTGDAELTNLMPTFLALAEDRIYSGESNSPKIRVAAMRQFAQLANGTRPAGFLEAIKVAEADSPEKSLLYVPMDKMPQERRAFSWDGETLVLSEDQGFPIDLTYYAKLTTPSTDIDTNWLMDNHPRLYLSAMLVEVARYTVDGEMAAREISNYASAAQTVNSTDKAAQMSGSQIVMRNRMGY